MCTRNAPRPFFSCWLHADVFAWLRVAGPNPTLIRGVRREDALAAGFKEKHLAAAHLGETDADGCLAFDSGAVFMCDYHELTPILDNAKEGRPDYVYCPLALFRLPAGSTPENPGRLQPVGILVRRVDRERSAGASELVFKNLMCTPPEAGDDGEAKRAMWAKAKVIVGHAGEGCRLPMRQHG